MKFGKRAELLLPFAPTYASISHEIAACRRVFYMGCAELRGYRAGEEWLVSHSLFRKP